MTQSKPAPPTAADKGGCDDEGKNMDVFSLVPALWNRPSLAVHDGKDKRVALEIVYGVNNLLFVRL